MTLLLPKAISFGNRKKRRFTVGIAAFSFGSDNKLSIVLLPRKEKRSILHDVTVRSMRPFDLLGNVENQLLFIFAAISEDIGKSVIYLCFVMYESIPEEHVHGNFKIVRNLHDAVKIGRAHV